MKKTSDSRNFFSSSREKYSDTLHDPDENLYNNPFENEKTYPFAKRSNNSKKLKKDRNNSKNRENAIENS